MQMSTVAIIRMGMAKIIASGGPQATSRVTSGSALPSGDLMSG